MRRQIPEYLLPWWWVWPQRRFDVRVIVSSRTSSEYIMSVQTLNNHVYAGRRAWRIRRLAANSYLFQTTEVNTYPWIADWFSEIYLPRRNDRMIAEVAWESFLHIFVNAVNGTVTEGGRAPGRTLLAEGADRVASSRTIQNDADALAAFAAFPLGNVPTGFSLPCRSSQLLWLAAERGWIPANIRSEVSTGVVFWRYFPLRPDP